MAAQVSSWELKVEPASPSLDVTEDVWLFQDEPCFTEEEEVVTSLPTRAQVAAKLLDDLEICDLDWVKGEPFSDWLEEKTDLPIYEDIPPLDQGQKQLKPTLDTAFLLQEFECIYGEVGLHNGALTPPQTPPYCPESPVLHELTPPASYPVHFCNPMTPGAGFVGSNVDDLMVVSMPTPGAESLERELAVVDELVRIRAEDMDVSSDPWCSGASSGASSPVSERSAMSPSSSSCDSNFGDGSNDPEWTPVEVVAPAPKRNRRKPYSRPVEDKKLRKKEQNKNAATRYRQKKKQEVEVILDEEKGLEDKNGELHDKVADLQREIKCMKGLMRDLFKAKGLLK